MRIKTQEEIKNHVEINYFIFSVGIQEIKYFLMISERMNFQVQSL
jgi:hypothetical protein